GGPSLFDEPLRLEPATSVLRLRCGIGCVVQEQARHNCGVDQLCSHPASHLLRLEPNILERLGGRAVEPRRLLLVATPPRRVAEGDPGGSAMADRGKLLSGAICFVEALLGLLEPAALHQGAAEDELRGPDLVQEVLAPLEELERLACELFGLLVVAELQVD